MKIQLLNAGFKVVTDVITSKKKRDLMWVVGLITFFMSAVLDNLTTTIVMVSLVKKVTIILFKMPSLLFFLVALLTFRIFFTLNGAFESFFFIYFRFSLTRRTESCSER